MRSSGTRRRLGLIGIVTLGIVGAILPAQASASTVPGVSLPSTGHGVDISFPQCSSKTHADLPANVPFAVVGVNGGVASNSNPCFLSEYNSALLLSGTTEQPHASVYVNTGNPALAATWWPSSDHTQVGTSVLNPNGPCAALAGAACAYVYGYSMAQADYRRVRATLSRVPELWWLDVETTNTWQPDVVANAASLTGMVDYFQSKDLAVGLYSTSYQWNKIAGTTDPTSHLAGLQSWLAGGSSVGAPADCEGSPLTPNGRVAMIQYVTDLDNDYSCHQFGNPTARISPAAPSVVGTELTAIGGAWAAGSVSYSYQWNRGDAAIPGATSSAYITTSADVGSTIWVTITGMQPAVSTTTKTSGGVSVLAAPTPAAGQGP